MTVTLVGRHILILEDEMLVLMQIEATLQDVGCITTCAASVAEAMAILDTQRFDAAIIDVNLGVGRSYPVADALARHGVPFAFSTGYGDHVDRADLNHRLVLKKPYVAATLVAVCERLIGAKPLPAAA